MANYSNFDLHQVSGPSSTGTAEPGMLAGQGNTAYGSGSNVLGSDEAHLADYVKVLYKRRRTFVAAFLLVLVSALVHSYTSVPIYQATTQLLIDREDENVTTFKRAVETDQATDDYYPTQYKILESRALARRTIDAMHAWNHPRLRGASGPPTFRLRKPSTWKLLFGAPPRVEPPSPDETNEQSPVIDAFLGGLAISPVRNSRLVDIQYRSPDPEFATTVANVIAKEYISQNLEFKFLSSKEASDWLAQQLGGQRQKVEQTEQALQHYREQTDSVSLEERQNIVVQKLADLNSAVTRAKTERIQKEGLYNQVRAVQNDPVQLDTIPAILSNAIIQQQRNEVSTLQKQQAQLAEKLGPRHPDMVRIATAIQTAQARLQGEVGTVVQSLKNEYQAALAQEQSLTVALEQQKRDALELNRKGIEYGVLQRDATSNRQIFEALMQRTKETGISGQLKTNNIRVVDAAETPGSPVSPNKPLDLGIGLFGGLGLAIGLSFFFEYMDNRIKTPDELKTRLGLPYLGMVPAVFDKTSNQLLINDGVPPSFAEAFRAIRTNVLFSLADDGGRAIVITSTGPGEGKTVVSTNLGIALAQAGQRVLLVDADMRKPRVHQMLGVKQDPGLSNVMVGTTKASEAIHKTDVPNLWVLPAGLNPPNPAELLGAKRFKDFVATLTQHFDWVLIDSPPVMAVTDSCIVAHLANGIIFVVGAEMTSRYGALRALEQLENAKGRFLGGVLNRVDLKHNAYYYSQYYKREYGEYYVKN